jgi:hypothetical protein
MTEASFSEEVVKVFGPLYEAAGGPHDMAVFKRFDSEGRLQCEVTAFFSPRAEEAARKLGGNPCPKPRRQGLVLIAGETDSLLLLFPE